MHFKMSSAICFSLDQCKILSSGNGLKQTKLFVPCIQTRCQPPPFETVSDKSCQNARLPDAVRIQSGAEPMSVCVSSGQSVQSHCLGCLRRVSLGQGQVRVEIVYTKFLQDRLGSDLICCISLLMDGNDSC